MKFAQITQDGALQPARAVVTAVGVEIGPEVGADRQFQLPGRMQSRPAQGALGGDMHHIGSLGGPMAYQHPFGRQAQAQTRVAGDGHTGGQQLVRISGALLVEDGLRWTNQVQAMVARTQPVHHFGQGDGNAIDLGWIGFRDHGDAHRRGRCVKLFDMKLGTVGGQGRVHVFMMAAQYIDLMTSRAQPTLSHHIHASPRRYATCSMSSSALFKELL